MTSHSGEKRFSCSSCDKQFSYKTSLIQHLKWHEGNLEIWAEIHKAALLQFSPCCELTLTHYVFVDMGGVGFGSRLQC